MKQINWSDHILNFLAVIIGVTLAFYVSNSADRSKEEAELAKIIQSFIDELEEDRRTFVEYQIPSNNEQSDLIAEVLGLIAQEKEDSLVAKIQDALSINSYSPPGVTFHSIVSSGKLDLFTDFTLRKEISNYYQMLARESEARAQLQVDFYMDQIMPWIVNETSIMKPNIQDVIDDEKLVNILILYKSFVDNKVDHYNYMAKKCTVLQSSLKELVNE